MKKRILETVVLATIMGVSIIGCASETDEPKEATESVGTEETGEEKLLRVGMECAYAPFNWTQESEELANGGVAQPIYGSDDYAYGYDVMMAEKIAEELGYDGVEIHRSEWDALGMGLEVGDFDMIIAGMSVNPDREKVYDFSDTYYIRDTVITVKKDSEYASFTKLSDFADTGATVTTQLGTAWVDLIPQISGVETVANYATTAECFLAVSNAAADITVIDLPTTQSALLTNDDLVMLTLDADGGFDDTTTNVSIAVAKGDAELVEQLNGALEGLEWGKEKMDAMMEEAILLQPANN